MPHQCTSCARLFADGSKEMLSGCPDCGGNKFQFMPNGGAPAAEEPPSPPDRGTGTVTETVGHVATKLRDFVGDDPEPPNPRTAEGDGGTAAASARTRTESSSGTASSVSDRTDDVATGTVSSDGSLDDGGTKEASLDEGGSADELDGGGAAKDTVDGGVTMDGTSDDDGVAAGSLDEAGTSDDSRATETLDATDAAVTGDGPQRLEDGAQSTARSEMVSLDELPDGPAYVGTGSDGEVQPTADPAAEPGGKVVDAPSSEAPDLADLREELNDQFEGIRIREPGQYELNLMELYEREETIIALQENGRYVIEPAESWRGDGKT